MRQGMTLSRVLLAGCAFAAFVPTLAAAAEAPPAEVVSEVVVTGSRVVRDGYEAPTPTTVVGKAELEAAAPANIADYINRMPELSGSVTPRSGVNGTTAGANFLNMRALGPNRTLVLLDGHRVAATTLTGAVDISLLPSGLVERVDLVTGGASAAWGSDAVAGVVNFVLDRNYVGLKGFAQAGVSEEGDAGSYKAGLTFGTKFAGDRGHFLFSGERSDVRSTKPTASRDWFKNYNIINNPNGGSPTRVILPNVGISQATPGGLITAGPLRGTQFLADGTPAPYNFGFVSGLNSVGGDGFLLSGVGNLQVPVRSDSLFARASFEIAPEVTVFGEAGYAKARASYDVRYYQRDGNITVRNDNAFLDATTRARMAAAGVPTFNLGKVHLDFPAARVDIERELVRYLVGAEGKFGDGWSWDVYYQHGKTDFLSHATSPKIAEYNLATDAVRNPAGQIVCRSTLTNPTNGCVPLNIFGASATDAARAYIIGTGRQLVTIKQDVAAANLRGEPFSLWAGPVSLAAGVEYRKEQYDADADAISIANNFFIGNYKPSSGDFDVKEIYGEAVVPLLADAPLVKKLEFDGAVRYTDYSESGTVTTWKAGLSWDVVEDLRLRGTLSRDIRAPNLNDLFLASASLNFAITDPFTKQSYSVQRLTSGNPDLDPERADTFSVGAVYRPHWFPGFSASIDYYKIEIKQAIVTPDAQTVITQCFNGVAALCSAITRGPNGLVTQLRVVPQNVQKEKAEGLDMEATWRGDLDTLFAGAPGQLTLRAFATNAQNRKVIAPGSTLSYAGAAGDGGNGVARWRALASATLDNGPLSATLTGRYISRSLLKREWGPNDIDDNTVPARIYFDLAASYRFTVRGVKLQAFAAVDNLLDQDPPVAVSVAGNSFITSGTNANLYDTIGRYFRGGLRFEF